MVRRLIAADAVASQGLNKGGAVCALPCQIPKIGYFMQQFLNIFIAQFSKKATKEGFWFVVLCFAIYLVYNDAPQVVTWWLQREDAQVERLQQQIQKCDSLGRINEKTLLKELHDCYQHNNTK